jgi:hypothetical protein
MDGQARESGEIGRRTKGEQKAVGMVGITMAEYSRVQANCATVPSRTH